MRLTRAEWRRAATAACLAVVGIGWSGCSGAKQTELVAGVTSQVRVPRDFSTVAITVDGKFGQVLCRNYPVYDGKVRLPRTLGVVNGGDANTPITISVAGFQQDSTDGSVGAFGCLGAPEVGVKGNRDLSSGGGARVIRRSRQPYVPDRILYLPMPLHYACYDIDCETNQSDKCKDGTCTCRGGLCVPPDVDTRLLVDYNDDLVFGSSNTCFRPFTTKDDKGNPSPGCLDDGVPPQVVDANKCIYVLPETASASGLPAHDAGFPLPEPETHGNGLNVRVVFDNVVSEVLDYEGPCPADGSGAKEGYCTPDPSKPQMFQLAPGLCASSNPLHKITLMTASGLCPSKTELQPICDDTIQGPPQPTLIDGGISTDGACGVSTPLKPARSALYILMDKSSGMRQFIGSDGVLSQVIGLPLSDPVFQNTRVAFKFLPPANANDCTGATKSYATLSSAQPEEIPFSDTQTVQTQQSAIASILAKTQALPNAPTMYLDAVMLHDNAYAALRAQSGGGVNRLALMLLIDRDATNDCPNNLDAIAEAAAAFGNDHIYTYVVVLGNEDLVDASNGVPPTTLADALAAAGGAPKIVNGKPQAYHVFTSNPNDKKTVIGNANDAIKTIANDLGS